MIKVKHFMDTVEIDDGQRIWVEPIGLTTDLCVWCEVDKVLPYLGPLKRDWTWFGDKPERWEAFRGRYHDQLARGRYIAALVELARRGLRQNYTLLHQGQHPIANTAEALAQFIHELEAYVTPEK
jgi:uncharacterized protein YeaO (DUF488 family)